MVKWKFQAAYGEKKKHNQTIPLTLKHLLVPDFPHMVENRCN